MDTKLGKIRRGSTPRMERVFFALAGLAAFVAWSLVAFTFGAGST